MFHDYMIYDYILSVKSNLIVIQPQENQVANSRRPIQHLTIINTIYLLECTQSYGENCQNHCSEQCINQTCDRFNGNCLCDAKYGKLCNTID